MASRKIGSRVKIASGMREFVGRVGTVVDMERDGRTRMYRVRLDEPVMIEHVGMVQDDLWSGEHLRHHRD